MSTSLPDSVVVLLCIIGAGFSVVCGYAVTRFWFPPKELEKSYSAEQQQYMRELRMRNQQVNFSEAPRGGNKLLYAGSAYSGGYSVGEETDEMWSRGVNGLESRVEMRPFDDETRTMVDKNTLVNVDVGCAYGLIDLLSVKDKTLVR